MVKQPKNYFFTSFLTILLSVGILLVLKELLPQKIFDASLASVDGIIVDSMALSAMSVTDGTIIDNERALSDSTQNRMFIEATDFSEGYGNMEHFFEKLFKLEQEKTGKVRVAYFSDSMTDGDLIVQDIRKEYQAKYGGKGVGFVGITSLSAGSRASVYHSYSTNWINQSFLKTQNPRRPFGIDGQVAFAPKGASSWVRYQAGNIENVTELYHPSIFYGSSANKKAKISIRADRDTVITHLLDTDQLLNTYSLDSSPNTIKIDFNNADSIPFYGVNFDSDQGFYIDNFSVRGNSGLPLSLLDINLMNAFDKILNYDLIVLHYGANVLAYKTQDYTWYKNNMTNVVNHLKQCFPKADILIVSTADKADKIEGQMQTSLAVSSLIQAQSEYAEKTYSAFINLFSLMGGNGSMVDWVKKAYANKDYTHFSIKGSHKISTLIYGDLESGYTAFKKIKYGIEPNSETEGAQTN